MSSSRPPWVPARGVYIPATAGARPLPWAPFAVGVGHADGRSVDQCGSPPPARAIAEFAALRDGAVARRELLALGVARCVIDARVQRGRYFALHRNVYSVGLPRLSRLGDWWAAVLAGEEGALLASLDAAARLELLYPIRSAQTHIVSATNRRSTARLRVHRSEVPPSQRGTVDELPLTSPARTVLDCCEEGLDQRLIERAMNQCQISYDVGLPDLQDIRAVSNGRRGLKRFDQALAHYARGLTLTNGRREDLFLAMVRRAGYPPPEANVLIAGVRVDFVWRTHRLVVELDDPSHATPRAFQEDRRTSNDLQLAGFFVLRFTDWDLTRNLASTRRRLRRAFAAGGASRRPT